MNHPYIKPVFVTYLIVMAVIAFFGNNKYNVHAEEVVEEITVKQSKVYQLEMNLADFEEIKKDILQNDVKYIAYPEALQNDLELSEIIVKDVNFASEQVQTIDVEVVRYTNSKETKQVVDRLAGEVVVQFADTIAPEITLTKTKIELEEGSDFDANDYLESVVDNSFGEVEVDIEDNVDVDEPGEYEVVYTATDASNNKSTATLTVVITEAPEEEEEVEEVVAEEATKEATVEVSSAPAAGQSVSGSAVANAALAQLGVYQDCTMLVTNALRAVGIYHHSDPAGYIGLGTIVSASEAQPGDLIYYADGGFGMAHIAVYIGGGQAVHGGWDGNQTVIQSAYVAPGAVFIRL